MDGGGVLREQAHRREQALVGNLAGAVHPAREAREADVLPESGQAVGHGFGAAVDDLLAKHVAVEDLPEAVGDRLAAVGRPERRSRPRRAAPMARKKSTLLARTSSRAWRSVSAT
jgi:hypothetical protein